MKSCKLVEVFSKKLGPWKGVALFVKMLYKIRCGGGNVPLLVADMWEGHYFLRKSIILSVCNFLCFVSLHKNDIQVLRLRSI